MQPHDHEWEVPHDDSAVFYEDGAVFVRQYCQYVEILDSYTDYARDEVYYEEGQSCDRSRTFRFDLTGVKKLRGLNDMHTDRSVWLADSRESFLSLHDEHPRLVEEIEQRAADRLCGPAGDDEMPAALDWVVWDDVDKGPHTTMVPYGGDIYQVRYEFTEER
jgi:hypothetical protein